MLSNPNEILNDIVKKIDITENQHQEIIDRYNAVEKLLSKESSELGKYKPILSPQGSFLLGTIIKPYGDDGEYDIDVVCNLFKKQEDWTQSDLKNIIGDQIKNCDVYSTMLQPEKRRCWTIQYAENTKFHLDIIPALDSNNYEEFQTVRKSAFNVDSDFISIRITDNKLSNYKTEEVAEYWPKSNPFGYAKWFENLENQGIKKFRTKFVDKKPVVQYTKDKSTLVRVVQLLKRHRDVRFKNDDDKPISIIITTLAGLAYCGEESLYDALKSIIYRMEDYIIEREENGRKIKYVANPINLEENFADKWSEKKQKETNFYNWINLLKKDLNFSGEAFYNIFDIKNNISDNSNIVKNLLIVPHREKPKWLIKQQYNAKTTCYYENFNSNPVTLSNTLDKQKSIWFKTETNTPPPFEVCWQIVNTGNEAKDNNCLRGGFEISKTAGIGGLTQKEGTAYTGIHWAQSFIIKDNICVAKSNECFISIK